MTTTHVTLNTMIGVVMLDGSLEWPQNINIICIPPQVVLTMSPDDQIRADYESLIIVTSRGQYALPNWKWGRIGCLTIGIMLGSGITYLRSCRKPDTKVSSKDFRCSSTSVTNTRDSWNAYNIRICMPRGNHFHNSRTVVGSFIQENGNQVR